MPSSSGLNTQLVPVRLPSPEKRLPHLVSYPLLTALAAQERRVLELKEELHQADEDLQKLKKQWAVHEATKKKNELRNLQPLNTPPLGSSIPSDDDSARASRELDRRGITPPSIKPSRRRVFAGSRHIRPLSLLSPKHLGSHSDLIVHDNRPSKPHQDAADDVAVPATVPELSPLHAESGSEKEVILETGKHFVYDFRQGLWTFFEDFKQLTVGDEGISTAGLRDHRLIAPATIPRRQNMKEKRNALQGSSARNVLTPEIEGGHNASSRDSDDDGWDNWDSPKESNPRRKGSRDGANPIASPGTDRSSRRASMG